MSKNKNMDFAIAEVNGKQVKITPGDDLVIEKISGNKGDILKVDKILLIKDKGKVVVGKPYLKKTSIDLEIISQFKGKKIKVARFKAKSRYRKVVGSRQYLTKIVLKSTKKPFKNKKK